MPLGATGTGATSSAQKRARTLSGLPISVSSIASTFRALACSSTPLVKRIRDEQDARNHHRRKRDLRQPYPPCPHGAHELGDVCQNAPSAFPRAEHAFATWDGS